MQVSFDEYWSNEGARYCALNHEDRARHAWDHLHKLQTGAFLQIQQLMEQLLTETEDMKKWFAYETILNVL